MLSRLIKYFQKEVSKPLGRWKPENCNVRINRKVDLSNEDHCGPCGLKESKKIVDIFINGVCKRK